MRFYERGQALLIVILVMTVALTVGLSVATRTINNVRTTVEEESSQRAFSAAEAGLEQSMQSNSASSGNFTNNTTYTATIATLAGQDIILNNGATVLKDDAVDLWLSTYPTYASQWTGDLTVYWGTAGDVCNANEAVNSRPALEIVLLHGTRTDPVLTRYAVDPCASRATINRFTSIAAGGATILGKPFGYKIYIPVASGMIMRIIPLYAPTVIAVRGCNASNANCSSLPVQGKLITSVGTSDTTQRKLTGFQEYPKLPVQLFPFLIFSPK